MSESEAAWGGSVIALHPDDDPASSANLSRCITNLSNGGFRNPVAFLRWFLAGKREAVRLFKIRKDLGHDALNVLSSWYLKTKDVYRAGICSSEGIRAVEQAHNVGTALPHQVALAYAVRAQWAAYDANRPGNRERKEYVDTLARGILALEPHIRAEDTVQALRQLVRCYKQLGLAYYSLGETKIGRRYLIDALQRAEGEADTESQAKQLRSLIKQREAR